MKCIPLSAIAPLSSGETKSVAKRRRFVRKGGDMVIAEAQKSNCEPRDFSCRELPERFVSERTCDNDA